MEMCLWAWCSETWLLTKLSWGEIFWREEGLEEAGCSQIKRFEYYWSVFFFPRNEESKEYSQKCFLEQVGHGPFSETRSEQ